MSNEAQPTSFTPRPSEVLHLEHAAFKEEALERLRIQESLGQAAFRSLMLANGGAIVALFTLIGSNAEVARDATGSLWVAFGFFAFGVASTIGAIVAAYFMSAYYMISTNYEMWNTELELSSKPAANDHMVPYRTGEKWERGAIAGVVLSLLSFIGGSASCFWSFIR